jgi:hypothetical protein
MSGLKLCFNWLSAAIFMSINTDSSVPGNAEPPGPLTDELQHREAALYHHILVSTAPLQSISVLTLNCLIV